MRPTRGGRDEKGSISLALSCARLPAHSRVPATVRGGDVVHVRGSGAKLECGWTTGRRICVANAAVAASSKCVEEPSYRSFRRLQRFWFFFLGAYDWFRGGCFLR